MEGKKTTDFKISIDLRDEKKLSGDHLFHLLEKINSYGSIRQAATHLECSYRYAWGLIKRAEEKLNMKLVEKKVGGQDGGGAFLTDEGKELLLQFKRFKQEVDAQLENFVGKAIPIKGYYQKREQEARPKTLLLASTIEPVETGLLDVLEQTFYQETGILVRHIGVGSSMALEMAKSGRVDMTLTHAPELEDQFINQGWGTIKVPIMTNNYVLVGPTRGIVGNNELEEKKSIVDIFRVISEKKAPFISRGDASGTHLRELRIWEKAGVTPQEKWYMKCPGIAGNLGTLHYSVEREAYTLIDYATYLIAGDKNGMEIVYGADKGNQDEDLKNVFSVVTVNPEMVPGVEWNEAISFTQWLQGQKCKSIISSFGIENYGRALFLVY
ncbi:tungstate transport system substrate-binding protein [Desulfitispora alkaliphila]